MYFRNRLVRGGSSALSGLGGMFRQKPDTDEIAEKKWSADFSKEKNIRFEVKSEPAFDADLRKNIFTTGHSLVLGLKKTGCIAWVEAPEYRYRDLIITGSIRIDARGGYGAGGILFRMVDNETFYSFLISSKGYFRLDAIRNGMPFPLAGWTELPLSTGVELSPDQSVDFSIIIYGNSIVILIRGRWAAELSDSSIPDGTISFTAASYESGEHVYRVIRESQKDEGVSYTAEVFLESFSVDSRFDEVSALYEKWRDSSDIDSKARFNLAETFAAMDQHNAAMVQLRKAWETPGHRKTQRELLLGGRLCQTLGLLAEAEGYTSECFLEDIKTPEGKEALVEMAKILYSSDRFGELLNFSTEALKIKPDDTVLLTFQGHAHWSLSEYKKAAATYDQAFELDRDNGILAKNAANVYDVMGRKKDALERYLASGKAFLKTNNYNDLGLLVPKLLSLGKNNWEARSLTGKWAFAIEDWETAEAEFKLAEKLRKTKHPDSPKDGAQVFLEALLLIRAGKRHEALPLLEEAVSLQKDYPLFHFRLAENLFLLEDDPNDSRMLDEMNKALTLCCETSDEGLTGWINNFAAQVALKKGQLEAASKHLEKAAVILGDLPAVRVNQGVLFYLQSSLDKALEFLDADKKDDPEGIMANCAGNLLVRSERFEEADEKYRRALTIAPDNIEFLCNRVSCLIEMNLFGEADSLLARAHSIAPSPVILEMISFVAVKKGEFARAEQACRSALELDPCYAPSLLSLGWLLSNQGKHEETDKIIEQLDKLKLKEDIAKSRDELRARLDGLIFRTIECASCDEKWKVPKDPPPASAMKIYAMPPDNLPAGSCPACGKTFCIGCAKNKLDPAGRFICQLCGNSLKLINEGLKKIINDWAAKDGLIKPKTPAKKATRAKKL